MPRQIPQPAIASSDSTGPASAHVLIDTAVPANPATNAVLRTRLELAPSISQRSETQPVRTDATADSA
jgi:hypothetical protein